jgi:hypothetical protein
VNILHRIAYYARARDYDEPHAADRLRGAIERFTVQHHQLPWNWFRIPERKHRVTDEASES